MELVYHIGAHATDEGRLAACLEKNKTAMADLGIVIADPHLCKTEMRAAVAHAFRQDPPPPTREEVLGKLMGDAMGDRLVMTHERFISIPARVFEDGVLYPVAEQRLLALQHLFPNDDIEIHFAIRNPATFIPEILGMLDADAYERILNQLDPFCLRWSDLMERMRDTLPNALFTVWCNEDTPLVWSQVLREVCGVDPTTRIAGGFDLLAELMTTEGLQRFQAYLKSRPPQTEVQKRRIIAAFLEKFAKDDALEEELDVPGWTDETVQYLTEAYEEDVYRIEKMHGINFIAP